MDTKLLEELLYENESTSIDFKREQYLFENASDEEKGEMLKDILSFANSWRRTDAYILIGVQEVKGGKSNVIGITRHLEEASLQQFVNSKTNKPVNFSYEALSFEEKQIGIIRIPAQERPIFLNRNFGKLLKDTVYIRRGSSTEITKPDEIAKMGVAAIEDKQIPILDLQFADRNSRTILGNHLVLTPEILLLPNESEIPQTSRSRGLASLAEMANPSYYREYAKYLFLKSLLSTTSFVITNTGSTVATNVRVQIEQPKLEKFIIVDSSDYPDKPNYSSFSFPAVRRIRGAFDEISTDVEDVKDNWEISVKLCSIPPGAKGWSCIFYIGSSRKYDLNLNATIYADNLPKPLVTSLKLSTKPQERSVDLDELISIADADR